MDDPNHGICTSSTEKRPWDARVARRLVEPLKESSVAPNHLTTVRLLVGLGSAAAFLPGTYGWSNLGALLLVLSNFLDHADGELARISGKMSRFGHFYDIASDALVTVAIFVAIGIGVGAHSRAALVAPPAILGLLAGGAIALIFLLRLRIEELAGKAGTLQAFVGGFEAEDVLYLLPIATLCDSTLPLLIAAAVGAPLYAIIVGLEYRRVTRKPRSMLSSSD